MGPSGVTPSPLGPSPATSPVGGSSPFGPSEGASPFGPSSFPVFGVGGGFPLEGASCPLGAELP